MAKLALHLFGPPRVELDGQPIEINRRKSLALLIYLALHPGMRSRDLLATLFWPGYSQTSARGNLRRALFILKQALPGEWLETNRQHLALRQDADIWVDVVAFRKAAQERTTAQELERAVEIFDQTFLAGFMLPDAAEFDDWSTSERESLTRELNDTLELLVRICAGQREYVAAIAHAKRRVDLDPLYEPGQRSLMGLYAESGQRAAALHQYDECVRILQEDLSISPAEETIALSLQIRQGLHLTQTIAEPPAHRLESGRVKRHAASIDGSDSGLTDSQPPPSNDSFERHPALQTPNNLPSPLTPLIGRKREMAALDEMLAQADVRLVTIIGPGGMGKTRLGLATGASRSTMERFHHGVFFVALAFLSDPRQIAPAVAEALHFQLERGAVQTRPPEKQVADYLREKQMLLLLDNFEHLLEGMEFIGNILEAAPAVKILVTSRERLRFPGEHVYPIQGLDTEMDVAEPAAVRLFVESARRAMPEFALNHHNVGHVTSICRLTEGMPLAIELAAAWVELLPPSAIIDELRRSLDFLTRDLRGVTERHHSIRAVFDVMWHRMDEEEQTSFAQLSVFKGGFTRSAALNITGTSIHRLSALVGKSLVQYTSTHNRYAIHELLRQYGGDQQLLRPVAKEAVLDRFAAYYCAFVQTNEAHLKGTRQQLALTALESEIENIEVAWQWIVCKSDAARLDQAIDGIGTFYQMQGRYYEGTAAFHRAVQGLEGCTSLPIKRTLAKSLVWSAAFARITGDVDEARLCLQRGTGLLDEIESTNDMIPSVRAFALLEMGNLDRLRDAYTARERYEQSLRLYEQLGDAWGMAGAQEGLGFVANEIGDRSDYRKRTEAALATRQILGDRTGIARALAEVSRAVRSLGRLDEALTLAKESVDMYRQLEDRAGLAGALSNLGDVLNWLGRTSEAKEALEASVSLNRELGDRRALADAMGKLASSHARTAEYDLASQEAELALSMSRELGDESRVVWCLMVLGKVAMYSGDYERARQYLEESLGVLSEKGMWVIQAWSHSVMGSVAWGLGNLALAREHIVLALATGVQSSDFNTTIQALQAAALWLSEGRDKARALEVYSMVRLHPKVNSPQWFRDVVEPHFATVAAQLPPATVATAQELGSRLDVWEAAANVLADLEK